MTSDEGRTTQRGGQVRLAEVALPGALLLFGVYGSVESFFLEWPAGLMSGIAGLALAILAACVIAREWFTGSSGDAVAAESQDLVPVGMIWRPLLWSGLFLAVIVLIGLKWGLLLWVVVYLFWHRARLLPLVLISSGMLAVVHFGVEGGLGIQLFKGVLFGAFLPRF